MSFEVNLFAEISPFFSYANTNNPSIPVSSWQGPNGLRVHLAYANCVSCGMKRFTNHQLLNICRGTDTYFCGPCYSKVAKVLAKHSKNEVFDRIWNDLLFGQK